MRSIGKGLHVQYYGLGLLNFTVMEFVTIPQSTRFYGANKPQADVLCSRKDVSTEAWRIYCICLFNPHHVPVAKPPVEAVRSVLIPKQQIQCVSFINMNWQLVALVKHKHLVCEDNVCPALSVLNFTLKLM